jgi:hypothetical protein
VFLNLIRFVACELVVVDHFFNSVSTRPSGRLIQVRQHDKRSSMLLFFVLSGLLITYSLHNKLGNPESPFSELFCVQVLNVSTNTAGYKRHRLFLCTFHRKEVQTASHNNQETAAHVTMLRAWHDIPFFACPPFAHAHKAVWYIAIHTIFMNRPTLTARALR